MDIITINKILYKEELRMIENLKKSIALLLSAMLMLMTSLDALFPVLSAIAVNDSVVETENNTENSDNEFYNSDSEVTETDNENNSVQEYNSDYAVYAESDIPEGDGQSNPYQINTLKQLYWFADEVNVNGNTSINAVLNTNLVVNNNVFNSDGSLKADTDLNKWTPIGNSSKKYTGTFDGQNHTISGLYFNDENISDVGLFGYISCGTIKNIGITNSYLKGDKRIGSVCGYNDGKESQIINCYNNASTVSGSEKTGGICGYNYIGTIKNSYNTGTVSSSSSISGGICGYNQDGKVLNSYNAGVISGNSSGGICGEAYDGSFLNCYSHSSYKDNIVGAEYYPVTNKNCDVKSSEQFESGEVAYLLGGIWGQKIGTDSMPVLNGEKVYQNVTYKGCGEKNKGETVSSKYSNTEGDTYLNETHNFDNGICTGCGIYELIEPKENNGYYQIGNVNHLYWFANEVNNGNGSINAVLTADIVVNQNVLNEDGTLNSSSSLVEWTPIGNGKRYSGIFDGQNHTISGLYCNQNANYVGLIGYYKNSSGEIKNVGVIDSYFSGEQDVGGICGTNYGGKIINCYSISTVKGSEAGGICGNNDDSGTIENSYSIGKISGPINVGGICGHNSHDSTVANCYYNSSVYSGEAIGFDSATSNNVEGKTTEQFASGEVTFLLNDEVWGQKISTDSRPVFNGEPVYQNIIYFSCSKEFPGDCTYSYSNTQADPIYPEHNYKNGVCTVCGTYESEPELKDDYYQIETIGHLLWFAEQVNKHGNININAVLTADIVLNQNLLNKDGTLNSSSDLSEWIPIGDESNKYAGIFDGQKHKISGLYFNEENTEYVGLFGYNSGTIKNVGIVDSYFKGKRHVGAVCGDNDGTITNCYNTGTVNGSLRDIGGVCGWNKGTIENSHNTGSVSSGSSTVGGICGDNDNIITNCDNTGTVNGSAQIGGVCGYNEKTVENSYNTGTINGSLIDIGGICGWNRKEKENLGSIINCYNTGTVNANGDVGGNGNGRVGGICGINDSGTIENSYNTGAVNSYNTTASTDFGVGGICGKNYKGTIENSYSTGSVSGSNDYVGGVCGYNYENSTITNCYYNNSVYNGEAFGSDSGTSDKVEGKTTEQFANGEVAYLLQEVQESEIWGQKIGTDSIPVLNGEKVYKNAIYSGCCEQNQGEKTYDYSNTKGDTYLKEIHKFENGICTACGAYEPAPLENGYYQISTANQLYWLAEAVNSGNTKINAVLTDDIVVNNNLLASLTFDKYENVNNGSQFKQWTPIGASEANAYTGEFDGQNHTISGLYCNRNINGNGLFGYNAGTIKNIGVIDSYFGRNLSVGAICGYNKEFGKIINTYNTSTVRGYAYVGGICGLNDGGTIENSYNAGIVKSYSSGMAGGICGNNAEGTITNSYNIGSVSGKRNIGGISGYNYSNNKIINCYNIGTVSGSENVGGVCGYIYRTKVENCYNTGTVSGSSSVGGICGYNNETEVKNCYYLENCNADGTTFTNSEGTAKTSEQFKNGEVAYSLQDKQDNQETVIWGQEIGTDSLPVLNGENRVYKVTAYSSVGNEIISEIYTNNSVTVTAPVKEGYNFDGWYTIDESTEKLLCSSREYIFDATKDIGVIAVYKSLETVNITINCDREYILNGVSKSSATTESYSIGSTVTLSCNDEDFAYWQNNAGTILSRKSEYSFVVTNAETISAVFNEKPEENKATLIFESLYGQVIATRQLGSGESMEKISLPVRTGYDALGWDFDGDGKYDESKDTLESAITRGLESGSAVKIVPVYKLTGKTYTITVVNGTGSGEYNENDIVTAVANEIEIEMKFSHWEDSDGNVLSYNEKYVFYASEDTTVEAVYVTMETEINAKGTTNIIGINRTEADKDTKKGKLSFVSMSTVPEGCKINKAGVIATSDSAVGTSNEFTDKSAQFVRGMSSDKKAVRYTWTKGNIQTGDKWYVRAYLVYTDSNGNIHTVYSDVVSQEY